MNSEIRAYHWVQLPEDTAIALENDEKVKLIKAFYSYQSNDGTQMREYHIDTHPVLQKHVNNTRMRGDLSVRKPASDRPLIIIGQDECVVKQYSFSSKTWEGKDGEKKLLPKSDGYSLMMSAFCSRCFGLGLNVTEQQLEEINDRRSNGATANYISVDAAMEIYGTTKKKPITDAHTLIQYIMVGINADGYWNNNYMVLQIEDAIDVTSVVYPHCDVMFLMDQSSGHGKAAKGSIEVSKLNKFWGGSTNAVREMKDTIIKEVGTYNYNDTENPQLQINDVQKLQFSPSDKGPFYLKEPKRTQEKIPAPAGKKRKYKYNIAEILKKLKDEHDFVPKRRYLKDEIHNLAKERNIPLEIEIDEIKPGWQNSPKGLLQLLYERQKIDRNKISTYTMTGAKDQKDGDGNVLPQYQKYLLPKLMSECEDIKEQKTCMQELFLNLSQLQDQNLVLLTSPKYHC